MQGGDRGEQQLLAQLRNGDEQAFVAFFNDCFPRLYRFVLPRVGRDPALAEELTQQVLARAIPRLGTFRGESLLFTWLCQIARHELSDYWQRRGHDAAHLRRFNDEEELRSALESLAAPEDSGPVAAHSALQLKRAVQVAMDRLSPGHASLLEWQYLEGLSVQQIADRQGQTLIAAQSALARARRDFQEVFRSLGRPGIEDLL